MEKQHVVLGALAVFNLATSYLVWRSLRNVTLSEVVAEKDMQTRSDGTLLPATSYSRVVGMVGGMILAAFIWGLGNVVIYTAITSPPDVSKVLEGVSTFIVGCASLFLPYAANQVREAFSKRNEGPGNNKTGGQTVLPGGGQQSGGATP
jgi:hypothetical protein